MRNFFSQNILCYLAREKVFAALRVLVILIILIASGITINDEIIYRFPSLAPWEEETDGASDDDAAACTVAHLHLQGPLYPSDNGDTFSGIASSEKLAQKIADAEKNDDIDAIVIDIDSPGGSAAAGEEVAAALRRAEKPTVALIRDQGTSAAYYAASGADMIIASQYSDVGSIGITGSYVDYAQQNEQEGIRYHELTSGKFKDAGSPDKSLTPEERDLFLRDITIMHEQFVEAIATNRSIPRDAVYALADGSSILGKMAMEKGLIDRIGTLQDAVDYLKEILGADDIALCEEEDETEDDSAAGIDN